MQCHGYNKSYCPKSCSYSRGMEIPKGDIEHNGRSCVYSRAGMTKTIRGERRRGNRR